MMSDSELLNQIANHDKAAFLKRLYAQLLIKQRYRDVFGGISDGTSAYIFDKMMLSMGTDVLDNLDVNQIQPFRDRLVLRDGHVLELLLTKFSEYITNLKSEKP